MGLFDKLINQAESSLSNLASSEGRKMANNLRQGVDKLGKQAIKSVTTKKQTFTFDKLPESVEELKALPQANLKDPFGVVALVVLALNHYGKDVDVTIAMMNFLKGPSPMMGLEISKLNDQLKGKDYLMRSYFEGTSPENNYKPSEPFKIIVFDHSNSYDNEKEGYVTLWVKSSGSDSDRQVRLRKKPSTGEWFLNEEYLTPGIRVPKEQDPWA